MKNSVQLWSISLAESRLSIRSLHYRSSRSFINLSRFDGVHYGHRAADYKDLNDMYRKSRTEGFGDEVKRRILTGAYVLSHGYYDAYYLQAQKIRRLIAQDFPSCFRTMRCHHGARSTNGGLGYRCAIMIQWLKTIWPIFSPCRRVYGPTGMSIPCVVLVKAKPTKHPVGLQIIGNIFAEAKLLNVAHQFQKATDWHTKAPA